MPFTVASPSLKVCFAIACLAFKLGCSNCGAGQRASSSGGSHAAATAPSALPSEAARALPSETSPETPSAALSESLFVASDKGVFQLDRNGKVLRQLTAVRASGMRYLPDRSAIVFVENDVLLKRIDLATGAAHTVAGPWVGSMTCGEFVFTLSVQSQGDVTPDLDGHRVCIRLLDANTNMARLGVTVRVDLATSRFEQSLWLGGEGCSPTLSKQDLSCTGAPHSLAEQSKPQAYRFDEPTQRLHQSAGELAAELEGFELQAASADGTWIALRGNQETGDYMHFNWLLIDLRRGAVFPLPDPQAKQAPPWPAALAGRALRSPSRKYLGAQAGDYVGEERVQFLHNDRLIAGGLLLLLDSNQISVLPGEAAY